MEDYLYFFLITIGIFLIVYGTNNCPKCEKTIEYRYVPTNINQYRQEPVDLSNLYNDMFNNKSLLS